MVRSADGLQCRNSVFNRFANTEDSPSGCRTCISRKPQGMSVGGQVFSRPSSIQCKCTDSSSLVLNVHHSPLSAVSSPSGPNFILTVPLPWPPWPPLVQENLALARANAAERGRAAPIPGFLPPEFFEPSKALLDVRDVQDR